LPATASATHVQCGDTIAQDTLLDSDIVCTAADPVGLVIGGNDFTLRLGGYTIRGADEPNTDGIADDGTPRSGVTIQFGSITGFEDGIDLDASNSQVLKVGVTAATNVGIATRGDDNYIYRNPVDMSAGSPFSGIEAIGDNTYLWGNSVTGTAFTSPDDGIVVNGENPRIVRNSVDGCAFDGVVITGYTDGIAALNTVTNCDVGFAPSGTGLRMQSSIASGNCVGILVDDPAAIVRWNTTDDNCATGIVVRPPGVTLRKNTANNNFDAGIDAPVGTIDLGLNTASGNGVDCLGIICLPAIP
jgi:hypothetical protein